MFFGGNFYNRFKNGRGDMKEEKWTHWFPEREREVHRLDNTGCCRCDPEINFENKLIIHGHFPEWIVERVV